MNKPFNSNMFSIEEDSVVYRDDHCGAKDGEVIHPISRARWWFQKPTDDHIN
jgi:hypothetical protein